MAKKTHGLKVEGRSADGEPWAECVCGKRFEAARSIDVAEMFEEHMAVAR